MGSDDRSGVLLVCRSGGEGTEPSAVLDDRLGEGYEVVAEADGAAEDWPVDDVDSMVVEADPDAGSADPWRARRSTSRAFPVVAFAEDREEAVEFLRNGADEVVRGRPGEVPPELVEARIDSALCRRNVAPGRIDVDERRHFFERAIDVVDDVFFVADSGGTLVAWNDALTERTGYTDEEMADLSPGDLVAGDQWAEAAGDAESVAAVDDPGVEMDLQTKAGDRIPHEFRAAPLAEESTGETHCVVVARDITDRQRRERELRHQNERLEEFADSIAHDVRNPLEVANAGIQIARMRLDDGNGTGVEEALDDVAQALDRIDVMVANVLELAKGGRTVVEPGVLSLAAVAEAAWAEVPSGGATLETPDEAVTIRGDPPRVRRLLANLFRNSVEHGSTGNRPSAGDSVEHGSTDNRADVGEGLEGGRIDDRPENGDDVPPDGIRVRVGTLADGFYVADDGRGIPPSERSLVLESGYTTDEGGTGFGLAIVREIAEAHDWTVTVVESEEGGARFEFRGVEFRDPGE